MATVGRARGVYYICTGHNKRAHGHTDGMRRDVRARLMDFYAMTDTWLAGAKSVARAHFICITFCSMGCLKAFIADLQVGNTA